MTDLHRLQSTFQNYLLDGVNTIQESIVTCKKVPVTTRLAIYREAYQCRLLEALANNYPCLKIYLGADVFQEAGMSYIKTHPSTFRSIRWFGEELPLFLRQSGVTHAIFLAELAELEWKMTLAFDAADDGIFRLEQMAAIAPELWGNMILESQTSLQRMDFDWNVMTIWQQLTARETPDAPKIHETGQSWIIWRMNYITRYYALSEEETWAIDHMRQGLTFGELCEGLCSFVDEQDVGVRAASFLKSWIQSGLITGITIKS